jgi:apolipoprotein D and lipocalin family protein
MFKYILLSIFAILCLSQVHSKTQWGRCPAISSKLSALELGKYTGHWYEIARATDMPFQKGECDQANYSLNEDGSVRVLNTEFVNGKWTSALGRATTTQIPYQLEIAFSESWIAQYFKGDYRVIDTDYDSFALVYSCSDFVVFRVEYVWILSRTPELSKEKLSEINELIKNKLNIPNENIRFTNQNKQLCGY